MTSSSAGPLSRYRIERRLGQGGMAEVFLAEDTQLERFVAIKILSVELSRDESHRKRFRTEARAASSLSHPNICVIHEVGETRDGRPFLAMEYVEGPTLDQLAHERRLRIREVVSIGIEVAEALASAHEHKVIHRDIKPANIKLDARGHAKVLDFGLAKRLDQTAVGITDSIATPTQTGALVGTPFYMSPEQALGREVDARTDVFGLGIVLYELLTGQKPFPGHTLGEVINNVVNRQPEPLGLDNPLFSPALDNIVFKCLQKDPAARYGSANDLAQDLAKVRAETEDATSTIKISVGTPPTPVRQAQAGATGKRKVILAGLAAALLGIVLVGGWAVVRFRSSPGFLQGRWEKPQKSIAVLPFANFSREDDTEYLSDGLTEEITSALSRVKGLKVAARNSCFVFKDKQEDVRAVGKALRVSTVLEGSIRKVGRQLRVTTQLVNVKDGFQLWSETYDRPLDDMLKVQEEIAGQIVRRLEAGTGILTLRAAPTPDGHRYYLQALQSWNKRTEFGLTNAIQLFSRAIEKDPDYADAHAGLAASYLLLPNYALVSRKEYAPLARAAAKRALELDASNAKAHAVMGQLQWSTHDLKGAEEHFLRALEFDPSYATAHHWYGQFLTVHGRVGEGLPELETAVGLDPFSPVIRTSIPEWYYICGAADRAIQEANDLVAAFPDFPIGRVMLSFAEIQKGLFAEAIRELDKARAMEPEKPLAYLDVKAYALARSGQEAEARKILTVFEQARSGGKPVEAPLALIYMGLRDYDKAVDALEKRAEAGELEDVILCDPPFKELRAVPQFKRLLLKTGWASPTEAPAPNSSHTGGKSGMQSEA